MKIIDEILFIEERKDKKDKTYYRTHAIVDQVEVVGWSEDRDEYKVGDRVHTYPDDKWLVNKMEK